MKQIFSVYSKMKSILFQFFFTNIIYKMKKFPNKECKFFLTENIRKYKGDLNF